MAKKKHNDAGMIFAGRSEKLSKFFLNFALIVVKEVNLH